MNTEQLIIENNRLKTDKTLLEAEIYRLKTLLAQALFGKKSERHLPKDEAQLSLDLGELAPIETEPNVDLKEEKTKVSYERKKKNHPGRHPLPDHLPVEEIIIEPHARHSLRASMCLFWVASRERGRIYSSVR